MWLEAHGGTMHGTLMRQIFDRFKKPNGSPTGKPTEPATTTRCDRSCSTAPNPIDPATAVSAFDHESCKDTCTGGPNGAHALLWLAIAVAALVGAILLRQRTSDSADW